METMHSRGRKWACLLRVSLLSGFVLTKEKKKRKDICIRNSAIKCSMVPIGWLCVNVYLQFECIYKMNDKVYIIFAEQEKSVVEFKAHMRPCCLLHGKKQKLRLH